MPAPPPHKTPLMSSSKHSRIVNKKRPRQVGKITGIGKQNRKNAMRKVLTDYGQSQNF